MKNIAFFSNQFASKHGHGIARYAHELYESLAHRQEHRMIPVAAWSDREPSELKHLIAQTDLRLLKTGHKLTPALWASIDLPKLEWLVKGQVDLVHAVSLGYPVATSKPYVVTVHDLGPLTHPEYFSDNSPWVMEHSLKQAVRRAKAFICVSQTTADELLNYVEQRYKTNLSERVTVAHEGVGQEFIAFNAPLPIPVSEPYVLAAGKISPRKNVIEIIEALATLKNKVPHHLVTVGGDGWDYGQVKDRVKALGLEDRVHFLGYVNDDLLKSLYRKATAFIYPSLYEGFGLTVLEAMASGCPVITSNLSCLPEIAGDAALLVNPKDHEAIAAAIHEVIHNSSRAAELIRRGEQRARDFSWASCADKVSDVYQKVLNA